MELYDFFLKSIVQWQYYFNKLISSNIRSINDDNYIVIYFTVIAIAFIYGLIHAAGPGHGKALVALHFVRGKKSYKDAFKLGYLISIIHAFSALALTFGIFYIIHTMFRKNFNEFSSYAMSISALMIVAVGIYIIVKAVMEKIKGEEEEVIDEKRSKYFVALSIGIVPCPGVMTIVLFSIVLKKFTLAVLAAVAMSIGMGLTISVVGILSVLFASKTERFVKSKGYILEIISGVLILLLGLLLFMSQNGVR
ncbi:MAG: hypothetical protein U9N42_01100 [Campylobacterota bacterium]|nr:hypothetical protein [Campylobacterota bacterium]